MDPNYDAIAALDRDDLEDLPDYQILSLLGMDDNDRLPTGLTSRRRRLGALTGLWLALQPDLEPVVPSGMMTKAEHARSIKDLQDKLVMATIDAGRNNSIDGSQICDALGMACLEVPGVPKQQIHVQVDMIFNLPMPLRGTLDTPEGMRAHFYEHPDPAFIGYSSAPGGNAMIGLDDCFGAGLARMQVVADRVDVTIQTVDQITWIDPDIANYLGGTRDDEDEGD